MALGGALSSMLLLLLRLLLRCSLLLLSISPPVDTALSLGNAERGRKRGTAMARTFLHGK
jgi:hypothetical protein